MGTTSANSTLEERLTLVAGTSSFYRGKRALYLGKLTNRV